MQRCGARIPAFEQRPFIGVEHTVSTVTALFAPGKRGPLEVALHRPQADPEVLGNRWGRPALVVQGPDLGMQRLQACLALRRAHSTEFSGGGSPLIESLLR